jgi:hypothetical protein
VFLWLHLIIFCPVLLSPGICEGIFSMASLGCMGSGGSSWFGCSLSSASFQLRCHLRGAPYMSLFPSAGGVAHYRDPRVGKGLWSGWRPQQEFSCSLLPSPPCTSSLCVTSLSSWGLEGWFRTPYSLLGPHDRLNVPQHSWDCSLALRHSLSPGLGPTHPPAQPCVTQAGEGCSWEKRRSRSCDLWQPPCSQDPTSGLHPQGKNPQDVCD